MDGILAVYICISIYLCGATENGWWSVIVFLVVVNLTGMVGFIMFELTTVIIIWWLMMGSNTFERGSANLYIGWFSLTLSFVLVSCVDMGMMTALVIIISFSKLPVFGLHQWLPNVHVEASLYGSMILAGIILKMGIIFVGLYSMSYLLIVVSLVCVVMMLSSDGNVVMAYSSVIHISLCGLVVSWIGLIVGASHVIISPLMFMAVYCSYIDSGSRLLDSSFGSWVLGVILLTNLSFPLMGSFISEAYLIIILGSLPLIMFIAGYLIMGVVHMSLFFKINGDHNVEVNGWMVIFIVLY